MIFQEFHFFVKQKTLNLETAMSSESEINPSMSSLVKLYFYLCRELKDESFSNFPIKMRSKRRSRDK